MPNLTETRARKSSPYKGGRTEISPCLVERHERKYSKPRVACRQPLNFPTPIELGINISLNERRVTSTQWFPPLSARIISDEVVILSFLTSRVRVHDRRSGIKLRQLYQGRMTDETTEPGRILKHFEDVELFN